MWKIIKYSINRFCFGMTLGAILISGCRCSAPKPTPDPLAGWQLDFSPAGLNDKIIEKDYEDYIQKLSPEEKKFIAYREFFKDGTGQHALKITIGLKGTNWRHVLIYDKNDKRIKAIKFASGHSQS